MTLRQAVTAARALFSNNDDLAPTAAQDAELLLLHTLGLPRSTLHAYPGRLLNTPEQGAFFSAVDRRLRREPIQYITGSQEFYGLPFAVSSAVLIPRPETEHLVEAVHQRLPTNRDLHVVDVGTGSGIIGLVLAALLPRIRVTALDLSPQALAVARQNAAALQLEHRVTFLESDLLSALPAGPVDAILSNPPYIPESDRASLHPQVRDFEPASALFAGPTGLSIYERLLPQALDRLSPNGLLALEIGAGQQPAIARLLRSWNAVQFLPDLQGIPRVALARRP